MKPKTGEKHDYDSEQSKNERIGKPALAPVGEAQAEADQELLLGWSLLVLRHGGSFRWSSGGQRNTPDIVARVRSP